MAVSAPPRKKPANAIEPTAKSNDKKIDEIINRGSSTVAAVEPQTVPETIKNFNIKILSTQLAAIDELRAKRPRKPISPKLGVSLQDWMIEAIEEKIRRERKHYNLD
ncbi:hypothetical protein [Larkinella terrae]|uniref:Uncharacterized protein n=1 Tax=Larkinella terrae TaxID=2025311 RepID=A0A7K0EMT6_9BACT|nr:hypothetical protein [Larkinella terrae]MRS63105.1 hypothetical protein [Larkinella terrae]